MSSASLLVAVSVISELIYKYGITSYSYTTGDSFIFVPDITKCKNASLLIEHMLEHGIVSRKKINQ
jgi:hypothetical protein